MSSGTLAPRPAARFGFPTPNNSTFDPREKIRSYADLALLGHFEDEWLRGGPVRQWVPKAYADEPIYVFETGGSTGLPKYRINIRDFHTGLRALQREPVRGGLSKGADWLMLGPSGPRRLRLAIEYLAQLRGGLCFMVDLDPRWVNELIRAGKMRELEAYKAHVVEQHSKFSRPTDRVQCVFTTPRLLEALCEKVSLPKLGV